MKKVRAKSPSGLSSEEALFRALEDPQTAHFLRTAFALPEQKPEIVMKRWLTKDGGCASWHIAIMEKPWPSRGQGLPLLNVIHVRLNALDGQVLGRWLLQSVLYEEYRAFMRKEFSPHEGCMHQTR